MKQSKLFLTAALLVAAFVFQPNMASAVVGPASPDGVSATAPAPHFTKKETRKVERLGKRLERMMKKTGPSNDIGIEDPARTWLIRWLVCWGAAIVIGILAAGPILGIAALSYLSWAIWTIGSVCAVIWLLKILEAI